MTKPPSHGTFYILALLMMTACLCFAQRGPIPSINSATPYLIHYGNWTPALVNDARNNYKLVILHPSFGNITPADIVSIQKGPDNVIGNADDVKVFGYISIGEDDHTGPPNLGDGMGPRIDPRPSYSDPLSDSIAPLGNPSPGGTGVASYYLDDKDLNGQPDTNSIFGGYYVNPGDPAWYQLLKSRIKSSTLRCGIDELLTTTYGAGFGCDGLFLDTIDTPAPNSFLATKYEWTSKAFRDLVKKISDDNPTKLLIANRGMFFFNPNLKPYAYTLRPYINMLMYESYFTDNGNPSAVSTAFDENKYNFAPKVNAEANRPDGFNVIALGYTSITAPPSLATQDFIECQALQGWPLYRTNPAIDTTPFSTQAALWNLQNSDISAPVWDSTAAFSADSDPAVAGNQPPVARVGIQEVVPTNESVIVRWDVARDQSGPVKYQIYYTTDPVLNFATATKLTNVITSIPENYKLAAGPGRYSYQFSIGGLTNGMNYRFAVRAQDALGNEETNTVVLSATPQDPSATYKTITIDGNFADWNGVPINATRASTGAALDFASLQLANDDLYLYGRVTLYNSPAAALFSEFSTNLFIDGDNNPATGNIAPGGGVGSSLLVQVGNGYDQRGGGFNEGSVSNLGWQVAGAATSWEFRISRAASYADAAMVFTQGTIRMLLEDDRSNTASGWLVPGGISYTFRLPPGSYYAAWKVMKFTPAELADPLTSGNTADPDHDGISNALEYALDLQPKVADAMDLPKGELVQSGPERFLAYTFTRRAAGFDVTYVPQTSSDLVTWNDAQAQFYPISTEALTASTDRVKIRLAAPVASSAKFIRLKVVLAP